MSEQRDTGGPAFPVQDAGSHAHGMTLRDHFAAMAPTDEVQELMFRHLSRDAQELITGMTSPADPGGNSTREERVAFQLAAFEFKCAVNAAIRFKLADAMLKARQQ